MSEVWARDLDSGDWGYVPRPKRNSNSARPCGMRMLSPTSNADKEGYTGTPSSYIDADSPRLAKLENARKAASSKMLSENRKLVEGRIKDGVVYPTAAMLEKVVSKLKNIASKR